MKITSKPWYSNFAQARHRCTNKNSNRYYCYGGRGIKFKLTFEEMGMLWKRDNADKMKCPSIDRIDNNGNYEFSNCRFIEKEKNARSYCNDKKEIKIKSKSSLIVVEVPLLLKKKYKNACKKLGTNMREPIILAINATIKEAFGK